MSVALGGDPWGMAMNASGRVSIMMSMYAMTTEAGHAGVIWIGRSMSLIAAGMVVVVVSLVERLTARGRRGGKSFAFAPQCKANFKTVTHARWGFRGRGKAETSASWAN